MDAGCREERGEARGGEEEDAIIEYTRDGGTAVVKARVEAEYTAAALYIVLVFFSRLFLPRV